MKSLCLVALASFGAMIFVSGCSSDREKGIGAFQVSTVIVRNTVTLDQSQTDFNGFVGFSSDHRTFHQYDKSGIPASSVDNLKRGTDGAWYGTDRNGAGQYQVIFNDQQEQYLFAVTNLDQKSCTIYLIPKGPSSWDDWKHFLAATHSGADPQRPSTAHM